MERLKGFGQFIVEKLGVLQGLRPIADEILEKLKDSSYYKWTGNYLGRDITINCFITPIEARNREYVGIFQVQNAKTFEFKIKLATLDRSTLIHELKHMDRKIRRSMKLDTYYTLENVGTHLAEKYPHLFYKKDSCQLLIDTLYFCNPEEFEAYYQNLWEDIQILITDDTTREQKVDIIKKVLDDEAIFIMYRFYYSNEFDLRDFFKTEEDCNFFVKELLVRQELFVSDKDWHITKFDKFKSWLKSNIVNRFVKSTKEDTSVIKEINYYINNCVQKNYRKFSRLYTLAT